MDVSAIATAFIGGQAARLQLAAAAKMVKMKAGADASVAELLQAAQDNTRGLANVATGIGGQLDVSA